MFEKKRLQFSPENNHQNVQKEQENAEFRRFTQQEVKQELDGVQHLKQQHVLAQYTPQQKDQLILNLVSKIDCLAGEIFNLSNIVDTLMFEQKLAKEKYETLKSKFNTIAMGQQKEDILNNNPYRNHDSGQNALRYNQYSKKEMYQLLINAENRSPTSPRRVISSIGIMYKDQIVSQQLLRDRINQLENEIAALRSENIEVKQRLDNQNQLTFGKQVTETEEKSSQNSENDSSAKKAFRNFHSIDTMVQRYQGV